MAPSDPTIGARGALAIPSTAEEMQDEIIRQMRAATRVQVIGHVRPDGDCIGSLLGVHYMLEHWGIEHALAAQDLAATGYQVFPGFDLIEGQPREGFNPDLAVFVDSADRKRAFENWTPPEASINIDHHGSNSRFGSLNWIEADCAAVGQMLYRLARRAGIAIHQDFAEALLLAIMTDTGSFRFSNVSREIFEIAADLLRSGARIEFVSSAAYDNRSPESIRLVGSVLSALRYECGGRLVWGEVRSSLLEELGGAEKLPENLASDLRGIRGVQVAILFIETRAGGIRASLRGDGEYDVSKLAQLFGGGGHRNAAGITILEGPYESQRAAVVDHVQAALCPDAGLAPGLALLPRAPFAMD